MQTIFILENYSKTLAALKLRMIIITFGSVSARNNKTLDMALVPGCKLRNVFKCHSLLPTWLSDSLVEQEAAIFLLHVCTMFILIVKYSLEVQ